MKMKSHVTLSQTVQPQNVIAERSPHLPVGRLDSCDSARLLTVTSAIFISFNAPINDVLAY